MAEIKRMKIEDIKPGPIRHETLPKEMLDNIKQIYQMVGHYVSDTLEAFEIGFMRDMHPQSEVNIWSRIAMGWRKYHLKYLEGKIGPKDEEGQLVGFLIAMSMGEEKEDMLAEARRQNSEVQAAAVNKVWDKLLECYTNPLADPGIEEGHHRM